MLGATRYTCLLLAALAALLLPAVPAQALEPPSLTLVAAPARAGTDATVRVTLSAAAGPLSAAPVLLERLVDGTWRPLSTVVTDDAGTATRAVWLRKDPRDNRVRASYAGDETYDPATATLRLELVKRRGRVRIEGPSSFVDERSARLRVRWTAAGGAPVRGAVRVQRRFDKRWRTVERLRTDRRGWASTRVSPRADTRWRAVARDLPWVTGDISRVHALDNLPPGDPVRLPAGAPRQRRLLPDQAHAIGAGANAVVRRVPDRMWRQMTGISWRAGCPVGRAGLRLLRVNYWDYRGYRRRGEVVAAAGVVRQMAGALADMYAARLPIRSMYRVDRFGWSRRVHGGDDYASMAAGNTSAFNCRDVVGRPGIRSPHSWGRSLDVNTWENPYHASHGWVPNAWWPSRSHPRVAWRSREHPVVRIMLRHGFRWTYGRADSQHFDAVPRGGRLLRVPGCGTAPCD